MIVCPSCQHRNDPNAQYCAQCGASMAGFIYRACPACGALNDAHHLFCSRCLGEMIPSGQDDAIEPTANLPLATRLPVDPALERQEPLRDVDDDTLDETATQAKDAAALGLPAPQTDGPADLEPLAKPPSEDASVDDLTPTLPAHESSAEQDAPSTQKPTTEDDELAWLRVASDKVETPSKIPAPDISEAEASDKADRQSTLAQEKAGAVAPDELDVPVAKTDDSQGIPPAEPVPVEAPVEAQAPALALQVAGTEPIKPHVLAPLQELDNVIPIETAVALPHRAAIRPPRPLEEVERRDANLFQQIATEPASLAVPTHILASAKGHSLSRWGQVLLNVLVLVAVLVPYFTGGMTRNWVAPRPEVVAAADVFSNLTTDGKVLIAFDYTPTYAGELDPMALAILRQLVRRSVKIVALSTQPGGVGLAEKLLAQVAQETGGYVYGQDYVILGYLVAQEVGLRALGNPLTTVFKVNPLQLDDVSLPDVMSDVFELDDLDHVIVFAEDSQDVRHWIEQVQSRTDCTLHAIVSARIAPLLMPYKQSGQLTTLISAADSVAEYEMAGGVQQNNLARSDADAVLILLVILVAVLSNVIYISRGSRSAEQNTAD